MLKDDFYRIATINVDGNTIAATLVINKDHHIFEGHFPGHPVLPGACMLQMLKEVTAIGVGKNLQLVKADEIKFLQVLDPRANDEIKMQVQCDALSGSALKVSASLVSNGVVCFKFKGSFHVHG